LPIAIDDRQHPASSTGSTAIASIRAAAPTVDVNDRYYDDVPTNRSFRLQSPAIVAARPPAAKRIILLTT